MDPISESVDVQTAATRREERMHSAATIASANRQRTNLIWERTQAAIAVVTTLAYIAAQLSGRGLTAEGLANAFFLVIGFYFGRTNHARPGQSAAPARLDGGAA